MYYQEEQWVQSASGFWMPKQQGNPKKQHLLEQQTEQKVQPDPELVRDWNAYWKMRGQSWRQEPEIDQKRQQFLLKRLEIECDEVQVIYPFKSITLSRADIEWLVGSEQRKKLDLRRAMLNNIDLRFLPLERASFRAAELEGANFASAQLQGANFWSAKLKRANFGFAELKRANFRFAKLEGANFELAKLEGANFVSAELEGADFRYAKLEGTDFGGARLGDVQGVGPAIADAIGWEAVYLAAIEWSQLCKFKK